MSFSTLYRVSFYTMLVFATLVLSVDATDNPIAMLYPVVVGIAGVVALMTVDRKPGTGLSNTMTNVLGLAATGLVFAEYKYDSNLLLLALGHWFVYFQLIYMFRQKTVEIDWHMFVLGLVQVLVGAVLSQVDSVGMMMFLWAVMALWVLGLFSLRRDAIRAQQLVTEIPARPAASLEGSTREAAEVPELYPGLLNFPFIWSAVRVTLTTLALGGVIFLAMPRKATMARSQRGDTRAQHLTGFDDEVQLGQLGEILENDNVVMSVELFDENNRRITPDAETLWRGVSMAIYENGRWVRQAKIPSTFPVVSRTTSRGLRPDQPRGIIRQVIKLEPTDSNVLFGLRPMIEATANRRVAPELNAIDGSIYRADGRSGTYDYEVYSFRDLTIPQPGEQRPNPYRRNLLLGLPEDLRPKLKAIADKVLESLPAEKRSDPKEKALALQAYLRSSGEFAYSLRMEVVDPSLDPVEDFLVNRKEGHCEYYASALTLLLRSVGVHARIVNGFKGGDWNELARVLNVRQKHAHSWVEAYLGTTNDRDQSPIWMTLDPTPANEREKSVARVGGFSSNFRQVTDFVRYVWVFYVVGYNAERQQTLLYGPIQSLASEARRGFAMMAKSLASARQTLADMLHFRDARSLISLRGFAVSFAGLFLLVTLFQGVRWLLIRVYRWVRGPEEDLLATGAGAAHYRRLSLLLNDVGLKRPSGETQEEFAQRASLFLNGRGDGGETVADVPSRVVETFYRVRFGQRELSPAVVADLDSRLDRLEACLRSPQG